MDRRLAAILAADVVGYSALMAEDETATLAALRAHRRGVFDPAVEANGGRVVKLIGDGTLAEFPSAAGALEAALSIQRAVAAAPGRITLRIGVNIGDVVDEAGDIYGDGVNVAARLEALAPPGGVCVSAAALESAGGALAAEFAEAGAHRVKNIARPIRVHRWPAGAELARGAELDFAGGRVASVALLPFEDLAGDPALAAGIDEDLAAALSRIGGLRMIAAPAPAAGTAPARHGRELGAAFLVRGAVRAAGGRVRVTAQLVDCASEETVWADRVDGALDDVFAFQDAVIEQVAAALQVQLSDGEQAMIWRREAGDAAAYAHFLAGRACYSEYTRAGNARARAEYEKALARNPDFPAAIVGLARTRIEERSFGWSADGAASLAEARRLLDRAFALAPDHALAHTEMGHLLMVEGAFEAAREHALRAIALDPNLGDACHVSGVIHVCLGRFEEALHYSREALRRTPAAPEFYLVAMGEACLGAGRCEEALAIARRILERRPGWLMARAQLVIALMSLGREEEARREAAAIRAGNPRFTATRWRRTLYYRDREDVPALARLLAEAGLPE